MKYSGLARYLLVGIRSGFTVRGYQKRGFPWSSQYLACCLPFVSWRCFRENVHMPLSLLRAARACCSDRRPPAQCRYSNRLVLPSRAPQLRERTDCSLGQHGPRVRQALRLRRRWSQTAARLRQNTQHKTVALTIFYRFDWVAVEIIYAIGSSS